MQDGVNVWPLLIEPPAPTNYSAAHEALVLSKEVVIVGQHKLIIAQNFGWYDSGLGSFVCKLLTFGCHVWAGLR